MATVSPNDPDGVLAVFREAAVEAGKIALEFFRPGGRTAARVEFKDGGSPVTEADFAVDRYLHDHLRGAIPDAAWLSEETADSTARLGSRHVIIVDPIDGTRGFAAGDARWAVSIALVTDRRPVAGVVHAPVLNQHFAAVRDGGAFCNDVPITISARTDLTGALVAGPANLTKLIDGPIPFRIPPKIPSLACRIVHVAAGFLDASIAGPHSHDWDIAAADLILHEAGGLFTDRFGSAPTYNQPEATQPGLVAAPPQLHRALLSLMSRAND